MRSTFKNIMQPFDIYLNAQKVAIHFTLYTDVLKRAK